MKNKIITLSVIVLLIGSIHQSYSQMAGIYTFSQSSGSYSPLASSTNIFTGAWDDNVSAAITIPFTFSFNCVSYTSCIVSSNGFITFGATPPAAGVYYPIYDNTAYDGAISALGMDLVYGDATTSVVYGTEGSSPNRTFVVQWNNAWRYSSGRRGSNFNFQIRLEETSNVITIRYGSCTSSYATDLICQVGLRGADNNDFHHRTGANWASTVEAATNGVGVITGNGVGETPASGLTFTWTPPVTPTITVQPVNMVKCAGQTVEFSVQASGPTLSYQWQYMGVNVTNGTPAGAVYTNPTSSVLSVGGAIAAGTFTPYTCIVTNGCTSVTSAGVNLVVNAAAPPATPPDPTESSVLCNDVITRTGAPPGGVTWYWQGNVCANNTALGSGATYSPPGNGTYFIRARDNATLCWSDNCGDISIIIDPPSILVQPANTTGCNGTPVSFYVTATGSGLSFQWQENGVNLSDGGVYSGVTTETLTISDPSGLGGNQYRCIVTGSCAPSATSSAATLSVLASGLSGIVTVPGTYPTLRACFNAINTNGLAGDLHIRITASIIDNNEAILNSWASCGNMGYAIYIYPTGGPYTLSGSSATSLITLNGADRVTFDGRINQSGAPNNLIISNTNVAGTTLKLAADACSNTMMYCDFRGVGTGMTSGVISFAAGSTSGNDNNLIDNCIVRNGATTPVCGIYAAGTPTVLNEDNTVRNCNIYDWFNPSAGYSSFGIRLDAGNARWTLKGNSLYQTAARTDNSGWPIYVDCPLTNEFLIEDNYIGGTAPMCGGAQQNWTSSAYLCSYYGILLVCSNTGISTIKNNTIQNIHFTQYGDEYLGVIYSDFSPIATTGRIDVIGNKMGDASNGSLWVTCNDNGTQRGGITSIIKGGDGMVLDNEIGSFNIDGSINDQLLFNGIQITGTLINDVVISGNTVGHSSTANSIQTIGTFPPVTFGGIYFGTAGNYTTTVSNNLVANVTLNNTGTIPFCIGMSNQATGGTQRIIGNTIRNLETACTNWSSGNMPALAGIINNNSTTGNLTIAKNTIHTLRADGADWVRNYGIYCMNANTANNLISSNFVHSLVTTEPGSYNTGIYISQGGATISNNMVRLGINATGGFVGGDVFFYGIWKASNQPVNTYFNSVYIGGNAGVGTRQTMGYRRTVSAADNNLNNIYWNARSSGANQYAIVINNTTTFTSNYNCLFSTVAGALGSLDGGGTAQTFAGWQGGTWDLNSLNILPQFINPTGTSATVDLHITPASPCIGTGIAGTGILVDFDGQQRKTGVVPNGPCIGADEVILTPLGANAYGIYSPDPLGGNVADCEIYATGGTPGGVGVQVADNTDNNWANVNISTYQVITASNYSCMNTNMRFTTTDATPQWLFGNGANPLTGTTSPILNIQYSSTGRKDIIESVKLFTDFVNITMDVPDAGVILGAPLGAGCPTTYSYTSSVAGSPGFTYLWTVYAPGGCSATVDSPTSSTTDVTFVNQTGVTQVFMLVLEITTECCGPLERVIRYITIYPGPDAPVVAGSPFNVCTGGSQTLTVSGPNPSYSYEWYDASTGGNLLGSGTSYTVDPVLSGSNSYWVQATNSFSCSGPRTEVIIIGNDTPAPTVPNESTCGAGNVTFTVSSPGVGYTYNWYSGSCGGTLIQSSTSTSFTTSISATTTFYVEAVPVGCGASTCTAITATLIAPPNPIVWLGAVGGANNWFNTANWTSGCLPNCNTNVSIPNLAIDPDIGFDPSMNAACADINLQSGAELSFSDSKAVLDVCGNFTHSGIVTTNNYGLVRFIGSNAQSYSKTGSGDFHDVTLNNTAASPSLTVSSGNMVIDSTFTFISGKVITGSNNLIVENTDVAAITGHSVSNYVVGNLIRYFASSGAYDFPLGNMDAYELATIDVTSTTGLSYLLGNFTNPANATGSGLPLVESTLSFNRILNNGGVNATTGHTNGGIWTMTPDAGTANYGLTLYGRNFDNFGASHTIVRRVTTGPGAWAFPGTAVSNTNVANVITVVRSGISGFSQFGIAVTDDVLPVSLINFTAKCYQGRVSVHWATVSESENDYFSIERSQDGISWEIAGSVDGAGNSNQLRNYAFEDYEAFSGQSYYRLRQTDFNGVFEYFGPVAVDCESNQQGPTVSIYPNPFSSEVFLEIYNLDDINAVVRVYNSIGSLVYEKLIGEIKGYSRLSLNLGDLAPGVYNLEFRSDQLNELKRIVRY